MRPLFAGATPWDSANFNPATKADVGGQIFTGSVISRAAPGLGYVTLSSGTDIYTGLVEFRRPDGSRHGYIGFGQGTEMQIAGEVGYWNFSGNAPRINGQTIWNAGNFDPGTKANVAGQTFTGSIYIRAGAYGYAGLISGDSATISGFVEFRNGSGTRHGYIGYGDGTTIPINADNGYFNFTGNAPRIGGQTIWNAGNFDPATKLDLTGGTISGTLGFGTRLGQFLSMYGTSYGFGIQNSTLYARTGGEFSVHTGGVHSDTVADPGAGGTILLRINASLIQYKGNTIWHAANFDPNTKANLTGATFTGDIWTHRGNTTGAIYLGNSGVRYLFYDGSNYYLNGADLFINGQLAVRANTIASLSGITIASGGAGYIYGDAGYNNVVLRSGDGSATYPYKYASISNEGFRSYSNLVVDLDLIVGNGQIASTIRMKDSDNGDRFVHNNSGVIGFLNNLGNWCFQALDNGDVWTPMHGYLSDRFAAKANLAGAYFTGSVGITSQLYLDNTNFRMYNGAWNGSRHINLGGDGNLWFGDNANNGTHYFMPNGHIWSSNYGWLHDYVNGRADAYAALRVAKTGDTMTGDLTVSKTNPGVNFYYAGVYSSKIWVGNDAVFRYTHNEGGGDMFRVNTDGALWCKQLGDINTRIEDRAYAWGDNRAAAAVANRLKTTGGTMGGDLVMDSSSGAQFQLLRGGVLRWGMICATNGELQFLNSDDGGARFAFRNDGSFWTSALGNVIDWVRQSVNNKSIRLAYAGDLNHTWNAGGGYEEPYGGGVMTTRQTSGSPYNILGFRWRYLQMSDALGNWYTCGYV